MILIDQYTPNELEQIVQQSNSFSEVIRKLGYATSNGDNIKTLKRRIAELDIDISHFRFIKPTPRTEENIFIENSTASQATLRRWYIKGNYTPYVCSICGQEPIWQEKELTLILDHINGTNNDDRLENLRWVCPNCNQQLDTTGFKQMRTGRIIEKKFYCSECGKEITSSSKSGLCCDCVNKLHRVCDRPSREELKILIRSTPFTRIAAQFGVSDNAIRKWCDGYNLPRKVSDIKGYSNEEWELL